MLVLPRIQIHLRAERKREGEREKSAIGLLSLLLCLRNENRFLLLGICEIHWMGKERNVNVMGVVGLGKEDSLCAGNRKFSEPTSFDPSVGPTLKSKPLSTLFYQIDEAPHNSLPLKQNLSK